MAKYTTNCRVAEVIDPTQWDTLEVNKKNNFEAVLGQLVQRNQALVPSPTYDAEYVDFADDDLSKINYGIAIGSGKIKSTDTYVIGGGNLTIVAALTADTRMLILKKGLTVVRVNGAFAVGDGVKGDESNPDDFVRATANIVGTIRGICGTGVGVHTATGQNNASATDTLALVDFDFTKP